MTARIRQTCTAFLGVCVLGLGVAPRAEAQATVTQTTTISTSDSHQGIGFVIKGGPIFSALSTDAVISPLDTKVGWIGGLAFGGNRPGIVGVQADVLYARKRVGTPTGDADLDYLEVPVLLRVNAGASRAAGARLFGVVGPAFDVRLKGRLNLGSGFDDQVEGADVGLAFGGGIEAARLILEARYTKGLRNVRKDLTLGEKITTRAVAVMVGFRIN